MTSACDVQEYFAPSLLHTRVYCAPKQFTRASLIICASNNFEALLLGGLSDFFMGIIILMDFDGIRYVLSFFLSFIYLFYFIYLYFIIIITCNSFLLGNNFEQNPTNFDFGLP